MTVAAAIEIGAGGTPAPGLGRAPDAAHGLGHAGAAAFDLLSSTVSAATSFRANWQSLLVTLHSSMEKFSEAEAGQGSAATALASAQTSDTSSASSLTAGMDLRLVQGTERKSLEMDAGASVTPGNEKGSGQSGAGAKLSPISARAGANVIQPSAVLAKPDSAKSEDIQSAEKQGAESARGSRSARSIKVAKPEAVLAEPLPVVASPYTVPAGLLPETLPEASSGLAQAVPAAASVIPVACGIDEQAQFTQTQISADRLTDPSSVSAFISDSASGSASLNTHAPNYSMTQTAVWSTSSVDRVAPYQAPSPTFVPGQNLTSTTAPSENPIQAQVVSQSSAQTEGLSANPAEPLKASQTPPSTSAREQVPIPADVSGQNSIQAQVVGRSHTLTPASNTIPVEILATSQASAATPSRNPIQQQVASQSYTQTAAQSANTPETQTLSPNPSPALTPNQNWTPKLVQGQDQIPAQSVNQGVNAVAAPIPGDSMNVLPAANSVAYQPLQFSAQPQVEGKPNSVRGVKASTSESMQSARSSGDFDSIQHARPLMEGQSSGPAADTLATARADTGASLAVSTTGAHTSDSTAATTGPDLREAFASLDAAGTSEKPVWIHAGAQRAEVGFQDPALGWVGVRADLSGGGVHAQLLPGSADAAQALGGHLAGLNAYLAEHHTPVETLTLQPPLGGWSEPGSGQGAEQGMQQGSGQETAQGADASSTSGLYSDTSTQSPSASLEVPALFGDMDESAQATGVEGYHISVMA